MFRQASIYLAQPRVRLQGGNRQPIPPPEQKQRLILCNWLPIATLDDVLTQQMVFPVYFPHLGLLFNPVKNWY